MHFYTLRIFHTSHFPFYTLRIFHTPHFPHSSFSTLLIFHTPHFPHSHFPHFHFPHSSFSTLLIFHTPHVAAADRSSSITQDCFRAAKKARGQYVDRTMLCFMSKAIIKVVFTGLTILVVSSRIKIGDPRMNNQETWHLVDECVLSPLHGSVEVTPEDSVSNGLLHLISAPPLLRNNFSSYP